MSWLFFRADEVVKTYPPSTTKTLEASVNTVSVPFSWRLYMIPMSPLDHRMCVSVALAEALAVATDADEKVRPAIAPFSRKEAGVLGQHV